MQAIQGVYSLVIPYYLVLQISFSKNQLKDFMKPASLLIQYYVAVMISTFFLEYQSRSAQRIDHKF
jgi:hypothetical protein